METVLRIAVLYLFILGALRVLGKREVGQLSPVELVTLLLIPEIASQSLVGDDYSMTNAIIGITTVLVLVFVTSLVMHRFKKLEDVVSGQPTVLVSHGQLRSDAMNLTRVSAEEVYSEMRKSGLERIEQVKWAVLEEDGHIAIVPFEQWYANPALASGGGKKETSPL